VAHAYQRLGEEAERRGDNEKAVEYFRRLLDIMKDPDPELRPRVEIARQAIVRLTGEGRKTGG
jgi:hypothetical protein